VEGKMRLNLSVVASGDFIDRALNLIGSYFHYNVGDKAILSYWSVNNDKLKKIKRYYGDKIAFHEVSEVCNHARNPRYYFFKTFAVHVASTYNEPFLYLDSAEEIQNSLTELKNDLKTKERLFIQYPNIDFFRNAEWTTANCFESLNCTDVRYRDSHQYMGGFQAYMPTVDNIDHISEMYRFMQNPAVAGPSNWQTRPEGPNGCRAHRNDQSVLSILIEKRQWHQKFDPIVFMKYGDYPTLQVYAPSVIPNPDDYVKFIAPRQSSTRYIAAQLL